jgi:hypothetical protein
VPGIAWIGVIGQAVRELSKGVASILSIRSEGYRSRWIVLVVKGVRWAWDARDVKAAGVAVQLQREAAVGALDL